MAVWHRTIKQKNDLESQVDLSMKTWVKVLLFAKYSSYSVPLIAGLG